MAKRRRGSANGKGRESKIKGRSLSTETDDKEGEGKDSGNENVDGSSAPVDPGDPEKDLVISNTESNPGNETSPENLMPLDIQQMILGDLQAVGGGDEIIVSREPAGDSIEDEIEVIVESPREVEYEVHTDEEEEEELVFMNDEEGEDGHQYVIVVNSDYEVANHDDTSQEIMSIQNLELQGNSCGIITVVRESDYESSQESVDGNEEECDNINTVIGTIDGIHCVKISQYSSDDESVHEDDVEMNEIRVTETEIECFSTIENDGNQQLLENCEHLSVEFPEDDKLPLISEEFNETQEHNCTEQVDDLPKVVLIQKQLDKDDNSDSGMAAVDLVSEPKSEVQLENNYELGTENMETTDVKTETVLNVKESDNETVCEKDSKTSVTQADSDKLNNKTISTSEETPDVASNPELLNIEKTLGENCLPDSSESKDITRTLRTRTKPVNIEHTNLYLESEECKKEIVSSIINSEHQNLQEHIVSSNSSVSEVVSSHITDASSQSPKKENITSNSLQNFFSIDKDCKVEIKEVLVKGESSHCKEESEKQATFRSRSGSTDTTGSDSGSNSGSGRRRSGRIKSISTLKQSELDNSRSAAATTAVTSTTTPPVPGYEADKPVKVKSRWRRSSELEMGSSNRRQLELDVINANLRLQIDSDNTMTPPPRCGQPSTPPDTPPPDKEVEDILAKFEHLDSNEYLTDRSKSKDAKRMVCDCTLSKEELARGDMGCGEDCLNRLLMIECGARCMLGERCANKRFQNLEYAKCEVFKTDFKGYGLRAMEDIPVDTFLLEYVGEVLDPKEFRKRAKDYAKDKTPHFYFMALKSDSIIDATLRGNVSRFINHSCDPNAETQKWTVNGELRVGFFSKRHITMGEEITFDYKFQRYGKEAQKCYCQAALCRGWIGEDPEKENKWSDISGRNRERKEKERKKKEDKRNIKDTLNDIDLEEEIEKLVLKNRAQTLMLCRLMVRAEDHSSRLQLLRILQNGETACLRLFLDYHGLRLVWSWMMDPASSSSLKIEILETLSKLPIPNKTMLQDSKVLGVVEKWSTTSLLVGEAKDRSSTEDEIDKGTDVDKDKPTKGSDSDKNSDESNTGRTTESEEQQEANKKRIVELANGLLQEWASLKEVFRIPKKERIEQMKEHEREAVHCVLKISYATSLRNPILVKPSVDVYKGIPYKVSRDSSVEKQDKSYDRHWTRNDYDRRDRDRKRGRDSPDSDKSRKSAKVDDKQLQLSKLERRQQFAIRAAQEEEQRLRRQQESMWQEQVQIAAHELAAQQAQEFSKYQWMPFPHPEANMMPPQHMEGQAMFGTVNHNNPPPPFLFSQNNPHMHQHPPFLDPSHNPPQFHNPVNPMFNHPPPLPKQPLLPTPPLPNQPHLPSPNQQLVPNPNQHLLHNPNQPLLPNTNQPLLPNPNQHLLPNPNQPLLPNPNQRLMSNPNQPLLHNPNQVPMPNPNQPFLHNPNQPPMPNLNQPLLHNPNQPPLPNPNQSLLPIHPPLPNQPLLPTPHQSMLHTPPLPNQPYMATQQVQPLMSKPPPLPNQPHPTNLPAFTTQPPLPSQPSPIVMTSQPQPAAPLGYPQDVSVSQHFQTTPQSQFTKPPPFTTQPPLPSLPPAPSPQNTIYQTAPVVAATQVTSAVAPLPLYLPVRLPRWWKNARNAEGHTYYYNVKTKVTQWEPPVWELQQEQVVQEFESESESSESDDDDSSSDDEEQEEEKQVEEDEPESVVEMTDNNEDLGCDELGDSPYEPETMELLEDIVGDTKKKGKDILVQERIISPRTADEIPDKLDKKKIRELKERLRRQKAKEKQRLKQKSKLKGRSATSKCEADTSSDPGRKIKDAFRLNMAGVIVHYLNAYRKPDCKFGKITNTEDFKHLARKLTHFVMVKELKHCRSVDELECNDNVKHKARDFIKKYMAKFGPMYHRPDDD